MEPFHRHAGRLAQRDPTLNVPPPQEGPVLHTPCSFYALLLFYSCSGPPPKSVSKRRAGAVACWWRHCHLPGICVRLPRRGANNGLCCTAMLSRKCKRDMEMRFRLAPGDLAPTNVMLPTREQRACSCCRHWTGSRRWTWPSLHCVLRCRGPICLPVITLQVVDVMLCSNMLMISNLGLDVPRS